jgi:hypothetical protein
MARAARPVRFAWLIALLAVAACATDDRDSSGPYPGDSLYPAPATIGRTTFGMERSSATGTTTAHITSAGRPTGPSWAVEPQAAAAPQHGIAHLSCYTEAFGEGSLELTREPWPVLQQVQRNNFLPTPNGRLASLNSTLTKPVRQFTV